MSNFVLLKRLYAARGKISLNSFHMGVRNLSVSKTLKKDHYEVLGVKRDASLAEIKNAYFELSKIYHPDRITGTDENIAKFREISTAYEILGNETSRRLYDKGLFGERIIGVDGIKDSDDPIIQFYKQRQVKSQIPTSGKNVEEMEAWTQEFYTTMRKASAEKHELYAAKKKQMELTESPTQYNLLAVVMGIICAIIIQAHLKNSALEIFFREMFSK